MATRIIKLREAEEPAPKICAGSALAEQATRGRPILAPSGQANEAVIRDR